MRVNTMLFLYVRAGTRAHEVSCGSRHLGRHAMFLLTNGSKDCVTTHNDCVSCWDQAPRWGIGQIEGNTEKKVQRANPGGLLLKEPGPRL